MKTYEVINLKTDESHGEYETLAEARGCVAYDRLRSYSIWYGDEYASDLVEKCEEYRGTDDRARQGLGLC